MGEARPLRPGERWKPRASKIGDYMGCLWRAAQDRRIAEGGAPPDNLAPDDTMYADLGDVEHFTLQDGMRAVFPGPPEQFEPPEETIASAARLFGNDRALMAAVADKVAALAAARIPATTDGKPWLAEPEYENEYLTGHLDLLSQDGKVAVDLKTTAKPPTKATIKYAHLAQMASYHLLTGCDRTVVVYVDSRKAGWVCVVDVDWAQDARQYYATQVWEFAMFLCSDALWPAAFPHLGDHCRGSWCPYRLGCHDAIRPPPGAMYDVRSARRPTGALSLSALRA